MAKLTNPILAIAFLLVATALVSKCQSLQILGRRLTCSSPSPFPSRPALSGANVKLSCNGGRTTIANTTTSATGDFNITVSAVPTSPPFFPLTCNVFIDVPSNCTIRSFSRNVTVLRSLYNPWLGQPLVFVAAN